MATTKENLQKQFKAAESCMGCGDCGYAVRPAVGLNLTCPVKEVHPTGYEPFFSRGKMTIAKGLLEGDLEYSRELAEILYQCTECGACHETCHQSKNPHIQNFVSRWVDHVKVWEAMRQDLVANGCAPLADHARLLQGLNDEGRRNPYGEPKSARNNWLAQAPAASKAINRSSETLLFAGCTASYRNPRPLEAFLSVAAAAGQTIQIADQEWCCGSVALRIGDVGTARRMAQHNVEEWKSAGVKKVVTNCAGCYRTFKIDYPEVLGEEVAMPTVQHAVDYVLDLTRSGKVHFKGDLAQQVTYHDPCHLGRHAGIYDAPRELLKAVPNAILVEMSHTREMAWCCGAGGGLRSQFPLLSSAIADTRVKEYLATGASALVTTCPFCVANLHDALKRTQIPTGLSCEVLDLNEFLARNLA